MCVCGDECQSCSGRPAIATNVWRLPAVACRDLPNERVCPLSNDANQLMGAARHRASTITYARRCSNLAYAKVRASGSRLLYAVGACRQEAQKCHLPLGHIYVNFRVCARSNSIGHPQAPVLSKTTWTAYRTSMPRRSPGCSVWSSA